MRSTTLPIALVFALACGCGDDGGLSADSGVGADGATLADAGVDAAPVDAMDGSDGGNSVPLAGFGDITGTCGVINAPEIASMMPLVFRNEIEFPREWLEAADLGLLSAGGQEVITDGNAGGSSVYSEAFSFEMLYRCELATLLKTETEVLYDTMSKKTDLLVEIDTEKLGVSVTRAVKFPFGSDFLLADAVGLLDGKLSDILLSSASVAAADAWQKQVLHVIAYNPQHADVLEQALPMISAMNRADTIVWITVSSGADMFLY